MRSRGIGLWVLLGLQLLLAQQQVRCAFLQNQLPLQIILATPSELLRNESAAVMVSEGQAFQAVFSRPVIALGSDFGSAELPQSLVPFTVDCSVPGRFRWVTTNIARWDPLIEWPTDMDCTFQWNTALKTFDGVPLQLDGLKSIRLKSEPIKMSIPDGGITSAFANKVTDNQWNAYRGMKDDNFPEIPPDANITLTFSHPVYLPALQQALEVVSCCGSNAGANQRVKVMPCGPPFVIVDPFGTPEEQAQQRLNSTCATVRIEPGLPPSGVAILRLPKGVRYNLVSGPTTNNTDLYVWGLRRFRIPLRDNFQQLASASEQFDYPDNGISYRRMTLWLPHGLAQGVTAEQIRKRIWFCKYEDPYDWASKCNEVPFTLSLVNKGQLLMTVPTLWVRQHYWIKVYSSGDIKDAYGLPLEESEAFFFTTEPGQDLSYPELSSGAQVMLLEPSTGDKPLQWPVAYRGKPQYDSDARGVSVWPVNAAKLVSALGVLGGSAKPANLQGMMGPPVLSWARPDSALTAMKTFNLSGKPGLQLVGSPTNSTYDALTRAIMVVQSDLQYAAINLGTSITHYVTLTQGQATPVARANVSLYLVPYGESPIKGPTCSTNSNGTCTVGVKQLVTGSYGTLSAVVEAAGHGPLVVWSLPTPSSYEDASLTYSYVGQLVVDRVIVMPGDKLHVTGFIQERVPPANRLVLPSDLEEVNIIVQPGFKPSSSDQLVLPAKLNTTYGTFRLVIPIPAEATAGSYSLSLNAPKHTKPQPDQMEDNIAELATVSITVGTPRPPTAVLSVTVPDWSPPSTAVKVLIQASSYLGADVSGAVIDLSWTVPRATGKLNVTTDAEGKAEAIIPLGRLPPRNATELGDTLGITAVWIGPTRERIVEEVSVRIANGPVRVEVTRSPATDVPGVPFIMSAQTWLNDRDSTQLEGVTVDIYLKPNSTNSLQNCSAAQQQAVKSQRCQVASGTAQQQPCMLTIPCAANLKLVACPVSFANGTKVKGLDGQPGCSETPVGRNTTDWQKSPWSIMPELGLLKDRQNYTVGSTATLSWVNAYWRPASGLLVWGNSRLTKQKVLGTVPVGPNSVSLTLGDECLCGCQASIVLSLPRPAAGDATSKVQAAVTPTADLVLPTSKLFDPLMPATASATVRLDVLEDNRLNVSVKVVVDEAGGASGGSPALPASLFKRTALGPHGKVLPVVRPGADANIEVTVTDYFTGVPASEAEVTIVVTDQAILDLLPYPLPDIAADMMSMPSIQSFIKEINDYRTSRRNINITFASLQRRLKIDPWLPLVTTVSPSTSTNYQGWGQRVTYPVSSVVDASDQDYLREFSSPLTQTPFYTWGLSQRYPAGSSGKGDPGAALRLSSEFLTTPLFTVIKTVTDGSATVKFKAPPNLSTFNVRAYAVSKGSTSKSSKYGANETQVVVRQPLSLTPSVPQNVRVGDDFEAGVLVSAPDAAAPILVEITSSVVGANQTSDQGTNVSTSPTTGGTSKSSALSQEAAPAALSGKKLLATGEQPPDGSLVLVSTDPVTSTVTLSPQQQQMEVRFRFRAAAIGASGLRFVARVQTQQQPAGIANLESARVGEAAVAQESQLPAAEVKPFRTKIFGTEILIGTPEQVASYSQAADALLHQQAATSSRSLLQETSAAADGWTVADAVQQDVTVLGQQGPVFVATSFALQAQGNVTSGSSRQEGLVLPAATPGSGSVNLQAGVGFLPAIKVSFNSLVQQQQAAASAYDNPATYTPYGPDALSTALLPAFLARYTSAATSPAALSSNRTNSTAAATSSPAASLTAMQLNASTAAAKAVTSNKLTSKSAGLLYYAASDTSSYQVTPSVTLNAWAAWLTSQVSGTAASGAVSKATLDGLPYSKQIRTAAATWKSTVASQLIKNAESARSPPKYPFRLSQPPPRMYLNFEELSWARLALGPGWSPPAGTSKEVVADLALNRQILAATTAGNMSAGGQARTGLTLLEVIKAKGQSTPGVSLAQAQAAVDKLTKALLANIRVSGRTAYTASAPGSASAADLESQALALQFLAQQNSATAKEVLPKLAAYVAGGQASITGGAATVVTLGGTTVGTVASALSVYDVRRGSTSPNAQLKVAATSSTSNSTNTANYKPLLDARFTPSTAGTVVNSTTPWSKLPQNPRLTFSLQGTSGEISVAAGLDFTPAKLLPFSSYRGLWVERIIQTEDGQGNLLAANLADVVTVTVQLTSPDDLSSVILEVLMPGGLEPVDPNVYKDAAAAVQCGFGEFFASWWCPQQSTTRSVVTYTFDYLRAGTVNIKFKAIAATPGLFVLPPVKAYAIREPELMGLSAAGSFTICPNRRGANAAAVTAGVAATPGAAEFAVCASGQAMAQPLAAAKSCPGNCNANGVCNINTGVCLCNSGFSGSACQIYQTTQQ